MIPVVLPLIAASSGVLLSLASTILAITGDGGTDLSPWIGGVGNGIAVVGLIYVVRAILSGNLIARPVADVEKTLMGLVDGYEDICDHAGLKPKVRRPR